MRTPPGKTFPPDEIVISESPWISGTRAAKYFGPISASGFIAYRKSTSKLSRALRNFEPRMREKASALGANTIVGFELSLDPFAYRRGRRGLKWHANGTAALLEPLF